MTLERGPASTLFVLLLACGCAATAPPSEEPAPADSDTPSPAPSTEQGVREAFGQYVLALGSRDGEAAAGLVTDASIAHYEQTRRSARTMDADTLKGRPAAERLAVLTVRARHTPEELAASDGRALFVASVERGWVGRHIVKSELEEVEVSGDVATITLRSSRGTTGEPTSAFELVNEAWLFDLTAMLPHAAKAIDATLARMSEDSQISEEAALMQLLADIVGHVIDDSIWQPVGAEAP